MDEGIAAYSLETGAADGDRLGLLNRFFNPGSQRFLRAAALSQRTVGSALEVGCGQGQMARFIAQELAQGGRLVGVDLSAEQLELARRHTPRTTQCEFVCTAADQLDGLGGPFELVYSRFLLQHVPEPLAVLDAMASQLAPGGVLAVEDALVSAFRVTPEPPPPEPSDAWWYALGDAIGAAYRFPEKLPQAMRALGLELVYFDSHQPVTFDRDAIRMQLLGFDQIAPAYEAHGIASTAQIARYRRHLEHMIKDDQSYVELYRVLQIAVRRPA